MSKAPTGVEPVKMTEYTPMTRPRISGALASWQVELVVDR
jgi:hypothetical protein